MKRRDFLKAFSASTTIAAATSLSYISGAQPIIETLERSIILPGDNDFNVDWVFEDLAYCKHDYESWNGNVFNFGASIPAQYLDAFQQAKKKQNFLFSFKLPQDWFLGGFDRPGFSGAPLPPHYENFLENNVYTVPSQNISICTDVLYEEGFFTVELLSAELAWLDE